MDRSEHGCRSTENIVYGDVEIEKGIERKKNDYRMAIYTKLFTQFTNRTYQSYGLSTVRYLFKESLYLHERTKTTTKSHIHRKRMIRIRTNLIVSKRLKSHRYKSNSNKNQRNISFNFHLDGHFFFFFFLFLFKKRTERIR